MTISMLLVITAILLCIFKGTFGSAHQTRCAYADNNIKFNGGGRIKIDESKLSDGTSDRSGPVFPNGTEHCTSEVKYCFTLWLTSTEQSPRSVVLLRGCWSHSDPLSNCDTDQCVARTNADNLPNNTRFCCCHGDFCNLNMTDAVVPGQAPSTNPPPPSHGLHYDPSYKTRAIVIVVFVVMVCCVVVVLLFVLCKCYHSTRYKQAEPQQHTALLCPHQSADGGSELDSLSLDVLISGGSFSDVYKGSLHGNNVAIKVFNVHSQRQYLTSERDVYMLPFMNHTSFARFYGTCERESNGVRQGLVVMEFLELGSLTHYLKHHTLDWRVLCRMCRSLASGLSHLHAEIIRPGTRKCTVVHRDLNSRNVMVRENLSCVIVDFGFAMLMKRNQSSSQQDEQSKLMDVGTRRYMAPEILDGAVNLHDCEAALKQIDVYSMGHLFWEIGTRCSSMFQGLPVPEYQLPFQAELGVHPTIDDMQLLVVKNKGRPLFPNQWKDSNPAIRALKETIEDCWDQDGDARLTALCVEERCIEMETLWCRQKGVSRVSTSNFDSVPGVVVDKRRELCNVTVDSEQEPRRAAASLSLQHQHAHNDLHEPSRSVGSGRSERSVSGSTTDTLLSPMESLRAPNVAYPPNSVYFSRDIKKPLYSHQGENPTVARNTHKSSDEDLEVIGNALVHSAQHEHCVETSNAMRSLSHQGPHPSQVDGNAVRSCGARNHLPPRVQYTPNDVTADTPALPDVAAANGTDDVPNKSLLHKLALPKAAAKLSLSIFNSKNSGKNTTSNKKKTAYKTTHRDAKFTNTTIPRSMYYPTSAELIAANQIGGQQVGNWQELNDNAGVTQQSAGALYGKCNLQASARACAAQPPGHVHGGVTSSAPAQKLLNRQVNPSAASSLNDIPRLSHGRALTSVDDNQIVLRDLKPHEDANEREDKKRIDSHGADARFGGEGYEPTVGVTSHAASESSQATAVQCGGEWRGSSESSGGDSSHESGAPSSSRARRPDSLVISHVATAGLSAPTTRAHHMNAPHA